MPQGKPIASRIAAGRQWQEVRALSCRGHWRGRSAAQIPGGRLACLFGSARTLTALGFFCLLRVSLPDVILNFSHYGGKTIRQKPPAGGQTRPGALFSFLPSRTRQIIHKFYYSGFQPRFMASISSLSLRACWARSATAFVAWPIACEVWPDMALTCTMDWLISSLAADCSSLAVAMALT